MKRIGVGGFLLCVWFGATACMDMQAPENTPDEELGKKTAEICFSCTNPACDPTSEDYDPDNTWCSWHNGWDLGWYNAWQKDRQTGWQTPWANTYQNRDDQMGWANSWSIAFSNAWGSKWATWDWDPSSWAWNLFESNSCAHPVSITGAALTSGCNQIVTSVCGSIPSCCNTASPEPAWSMACVNKAVDLGSASGIVEPHSLLIWGPPLIAEQSPIETLPTNGTLGKMATSTTPSDTTVKTTSPSAALVKGLPKFVQRNECVAAVCQANPSCCAPTSQGGFWGMTCVQAAISTCTTRYLARPRWEDDRVMVDACYETKISGFQACPLQKVTTENTNGCCQRALVLQGTYRATDPASTPDTTDDGKGRAVNWSKYTYLQLGWWFKFKVDTTIVPDQCVMMAGGYQSCKTYDAPKLWMSAGPSGPLYPDCGGTPANPVGPHPCNCDTPGNEMCSGPEHYGVGLRGALLATLSALITTDGLHELDVHWALGDASAGAPFPYDGGIAALPKPREAHWYAHPTPGSGAQADNYHYAAKAVCYSPHSPQKRAGSALVGNVPMCPDPTPNPFPEMVFVDDSQGPPDPAVYSFYGDLILTPN